MKRNLVTEREARLFHNVKMFWLTRPHDAMMRFFYVQLPACIERMLS